MALGCRSVSSALSSALSCIRPIVSWHLTPCAAFFAPVRVPSFPPYSSKPSCACGGHVRPASVPRRAAPAKQHLLSSMCARSHAAHLTGCTVFFSPGPLAGIFAAAQARHQSARQQAPAAALHLAAQDPHTSCVGQWLVLVFLAATNIISILMQFHFS